MFALFVAYVMHSRGPHRGITGCFDLHFNSSCSTYLLVIPFSSKRSVKRRIARVAVRNNVTMKPGHTSCTVRNAAPFRSGATLGRKLLNYADASH